MSSGWIKLHRQLIDWEWYGDINIMRLFIHCLIKANHKDKQWRGIDINRGQFYTSLDTLSDETGLSVMQLRTCFNKLKVTGEVTSLKMPRGRMITVVQYDLYQEDNRLNDRVVTGSQQADNRLVTATNNVNKDNKGNKEQIDFSILQMTDDQVTDVKQIRKKNKGSSLTQRIVNSMAKQFDEAKKLGYSIDELLAIWEDKGWKSFDADWIKPKPNCQQASSYVPKPFPSE